MDTYSARQVAELAGASPARVLRAAQALELGDRAQAGTPRRRRRFTGPQVTALLSWLAARRPPPSTIPALTDTDRRVLTALAHAPLGLTSIRAVARAAGLSPGAAAAAVTRLRERGLVTAERRIVAEGAARERLLINVNVSHPDWPALAPHLQRIQRASTAVEPGNAGTAHRVPARLAHVFWNEDLGTLDPQRHGPLIARRVLLSRDPQALAWASAQLQAEDWARAARSRGTDARDAALAGILARR